MGCARNQSAPTRVFERFAIFLFSRLDVYLVAGVYKCGFAQTQAAYDEAVSALYTGIT